MMLIGTVEQLPDRRNQHDIVGPNQFPQCSAPLSTRCGSGARHSTAARPCRITRHFLLLYPKDSPNWANVETSVAVIVPFESPSTASIDQLVGLVAADMARV